MITVRLGDIVRISKGSKVNNFFTKKESGSLRYIQIEDLRNNDNLKYTSEKGVQVSEEDILIAWDGANAGTVGYGLSGLIGSTIAALHIHSNDIYPAYLGKFLQFKTSYIRSNTNGATIPHIRRDVLENMKVPLLRSYSEQKRISELIDKVLNTLQDRKKSMSLVDKFLRSSFSNMFENNYSNWEKIMLGELIIIDRQTIQPGEVESKIKLLGLEHIEKNSGTITGFEEVSQINSAKFRFSSEHILYGKLRPYLNKVALPEFEGICSTDILPILPIEEKSNKYYIAYLLRQPSFINYASSRAVGVNLPRVNAQIIEDYPTILPPIELQDKFAQIVIAAQSLIQKYNVSLIQAELLFNSLMQKAFRGEL